MLCIITHRIYIFGLLTPLELHCFVFEALWLVGCLVKCKPLSTFVFLAYLYW